MDETNNERLLRHLCATGTGTWAGWTEPLDINVMKEFRLSALVADITDGLHGSDTSLNRDVAKDIVGVIHEDLHAKHPIFTTDVGSDWLGDGQKKHRKFIRVASQKIASYWNTRARWREEIQLIPNLGKKYGTVSVLDGLPSAMWFPDDNWRPGGIFDYQMVDDYQIQECFRVLHYDEDAGTYIVQSSGKDHHGVRGHEPILAIAYTGPLFVISESMVHNSLRSLFDGKPDPGTKGSPLAFGDYIVLSGITPEGQYTEPTPVRGVHAENGLYDLVINSGPWKQFDCHMVGVRTEKTRFKHFPEENFGDGAPRRAYGLGELLALSVGVNRLHSVITIASDSQIPVNPDKPDWIDTALDHRENKTVDLRPTPVGGKSDIIRCQNCNGRVFIYTESSGEPGFARCPHCRDNDGLQFPQLLNATVTAKETPVEGEDE